MRPLDRQTGREVADRGLRGVIRGLRLRHVNDAAGHGSDQHHAAFRFPFHQVASYRCGVEISAVEIDAHELLQSVKRIGDGLEVLGEAC